MTRDSPRVFVPPPLIVIGMLIAAVTVDKLVTRLTTGLPDALLWAGGLPVAAGALVIATSLGLFRRAGTRPEPWQPSSALVTRGIYRFTRNPMYLGMVLIYAGLALLLDSQLSLLLLPVLVMVLHWGVIAREERYLEEKFGDSYRRYKTQVRPWL